MWYLDRYNLGTPFSLPVRIAQMLVICAAKPQRHELDCHCHVSDNWRQRSPRATARPQAKGTRFRHKRPTPRLRRVPSIYSGSRFAPLT